MGIIKRLWEAFTAQRYDMEQLGFGFNPEMQMHVMRALNMIAPSCTTAIKRDWFMQLVETVSQDWILPRVELFVQRGLLRFEIEEIPRLFPPDWIKENKTRLDFLIHKLRELPFPEEDDFRENELEDSQVMLKNSNALQTRGAQIRFDLFADAFFA